MNIYLIIAMVLGTLISIPTIIEGSLVLSGKEMPGQIVLSWLVGYNVLFGLVSLITVFFMWKAISIGKYLSIGIFLGHFTVLIVLIIILNTSGQVALKSIYAMGMRSMIWMAVNYLLHKSQKK